MTVFLLLAFLTITTLVPAFSQVSRDEKIYTVSEVSVKPQPIIGLEDFHKKWSRTVKYPDEAVRQKIQGMVYVEFIVDSDGNIRDAAIRSGIGHGCDEAALKAFNELSKNGWKPGIKKDAPVKVKMVLPFYFKIIEG